MLPVVRQLLTALRHKCPPSQPHGHQLNAESRPASALRPNNMTRTRRPIALFLMLSSLHWLGSSLDLSNPAASSDEDPAVNSRDAPKRPVLQPKETAPPQSTYTLKNLKGQVCVRARLGGEYVVRENKKKYYFNLDPGSTQASGYCLNQKSVLSLSFAGGNLEFTFIKEGNVFYVTKITGLLMPVPTCKNCQNSKHQHDIDNKDSELQPFLQSNKMGFERMGRLFLSKLDRLVWTLKNILLQPMSFCFIHLCCSVFRCNKDFTV
ncbi:lysosome-associated membrane glycoprotein [Pimephales promelas]|nr:lysosome-associated membrane glycoprotein [Pimephales promelas]